MDDSYVVAAGRDRGKAAGTQQNSGVSNPTAATSGFHRYFESRMCSSILDPENFNQADQNKNASAAKKQTTSGMNALLSLIS